MKKLQYKFKSDILFKILFVRNKDLLRSLVASALGVRKEDIRKLTIANEAVLPELVTDKFCRLDLNMDVDGVKVDLEIQVADEGNFRERAAFYCAKLFASSLVAGSDYKNAPRAILISIVDFELFDCAELRSEFALLEKTRLELLCDKMELHFFELRKLPETIDKNDMLQVWLKLFDAETEEDLKALMEMEVNEVERALEAYRNITGSAEYRELERIRERARHDEAQALLSSMEKGLEKGRKEGLEKGRLEIAIKLVKNGIDPDVIAQSTGLAFEDVLELKEKYVN
jgi:predicted transposase/invertase (TIGR01784 family)